MSCEYTGVFSEKKITRKVKDQNTHVISKRFKSFNLEKRKYSRKMVSVFKFWMMTI